MSFWSLEKSAAGEEPFRQNRWYIKFGRNNTEKNVAVGSVLGAYQYALKNTTKPQYTIETSQHVLMNHAFNYPKNLIWSPIDVVMVSANNGENTLSYILNNTIGDSGYITPDKDFQSQTQISKKQSIFDSIDIFQINEYGENIEQWELKNPFITKVNYGSLSYENDGFVDVSFTITYDYALLKVADFGVTNNFKNETLGFPTRPPEVVPRNTSATSAKATVLGGEAGGTGVIIKGIRGQ
jgi:hypothetical protein